MLALLLMWFSSVTLARGKDAFDLVILRNGDIFQGTLAADIFSVDTAFGPVKIPYIHMAALTVSSDGRSDRIVTRLGEVFVGHIENSELSVLRVLGPPLPLHVGDLQEVTFSPKLPVFYRELARDRVETPNGDRFIAQILTTDLLVRTDDSIRVFNRNDLHLLDHARLYDEARNDVQLRLADGGAAQGKLMTQSVTVVTQYRQHIDLPLTEISTLAYGVNVPGRQIDWDHFARPTSVELLRDKMIGGADGPEMVLLKGGSFRRGDDNGDDDERPAVMITLPPFAIGSHEVTFEEYDVFCEETQREKPDDQDWGRGRRPVVNVSWNDAKDYTAWLSSKTRRNYRLPTDAEWEYAARGGTATRFWWGDTVQAAQANCEGCGSLWDGEQTAEVGKFPANPFGLHDTAGNVFEWVEDCFNDTFEDAPKDGTAFDKPGCGKRVIRGGAWSFPENEVRSANRWRDFPTRRSDDTGFRLARDIPDHR